MQIYCYPRRHSWSRLQRTPEDIHRLFEKIAADTDTGDLVIALYLRSNPRWLGGTAYVRQWVEADHFFARAGKWRLEAGLPCPDTLPPRFKLIRLLLPDDAEYPLHEKDRYGWQHHYDSFSDHLAFYFAHELHHYRRYHLNFHPGEGEHSANAWALERCQRLGFAVTGCRLQQPRRSKRRRKATSFWELFNPVDFVALEKAHQLWSNQLSLAGLALRLSKQEKNQYIEAKLRHNLAVRKLAPGMGVRITFDPQRRYGGQQARVVRSLRSPSLRIVIETKDGRVWRWPLSWLSALPE